MKTKRRQELRQNELIHQLMELKELVVRRWNWIVGGLLVIVLVVAVGFYWRHSRESSRTEGLNRLARARAGEGLGSKDRLDQIRQIADGYSDPTVELAALEALGQEAMSQYLFYGRSSEDRELAENLLKTAEDAYTRIISKHSGPETVIARAHIGRAVIAENRGDKARARAEYRAILDNPALAAVTMYRSIAAKREKQLDELMVPMQILPALPKPPTTTQAAATATAPASAPAAGPPATQPASTAPAAP